MVKLSKRFYEEINYRIDREIEGYMPDDDYMEIHRCGRRTDVVGSSKIDIEVELSDGYVADVSLSIYTRAYNDDGNYVTPPESGGTHTWAVTYLQIWDAEGELVEELNDTTYMNGEYNW